MKKECMFENRNNIPFNTMTVEGKAKLTLQPDTLVVLLRLETEAKEYADMLVCATQQLADLRQAWEKAAFPANAFKTTDFKVEKQYATINGRSHGSSTVINGYIGTHELALEIPNKPERLASAIAIITSSKTQPDFTIRSVVKDKDAAVQRLMKAIAANARCKAEELCATAGGKLGKLLHVDYDWHDYKMERELPEGASESVLMPGVSEEMDERLDQIRQYLESTLLINSNNIVISDTAKFVWEIV